MFPDSAFPRCSMSIISSSAKSIPTSTSCSKHKDRQIFPVKIFFLLYSEIIHRLNQFESEGIFSGSVHKATCVIQQLYEGDITISQIFPLETCSRHFQGPAVHLSGMQSRRGQSHLAAHVHHQESLLGGASVGSKNNETPQGSLWRISECFP